MTDSGRLLLLPTPVVVVQLRQTRKGLPTSIKRKKDASNEDESNWKTIEVKGVSLQEDGMHDKTRVHVNTFVRLDRISDNCTGLGEGTCTWWRGALPRRQSKSLWRKTGFPGGNGRMGGVGWGRAEIIGVKDDLGCGQTQSEAGREKLPENYSLFLPSL